SSRRRQRRASALERYPARPAPLGAARRSGVGGVRLEPGVVPGEGRFRAREKGRERCWEQRVDPQRRQFVVSDEAQVERLAVGTVQRAAEHAAVEQGRRIDRPIAVRILDLWAAEDREDALGTRAQARLLEDLPRDAPRRVLAGLTDPRRQAPF